MSEEQPLLGQSANIPLVDDPESLGNKSDERSWAARTAHFLETPALHKTVIALITIDAACVLVDLGYTFLSPDCPSPGEAYSPEWLEVLSHISLTITTIFLIEIPLSLWAFGFQHLNPFGPVPHASFHAFDAIIILTTFILEFVLGGKEQELAGLLIILRLWRLVKLVGGVAVGVGEIEEETVEALAETKHKLEETQLELAIVREENSQLRQRLNQFTSEI